MAGNSVQITLSSTYPEFFANVIKQSINALGPTSSIYDTFGNFKEPPRS